MVIQENIKRWLYSYWNSKSLAYVVVQAFFPPSDGTILIIIWKIVCFKFSFNNRIESKNRYHTGLSSGEKNQFFFSKIKLLAIFLYRNTFFSLSWRNLLFFFLVFLFCLSCFLSIFESLNHKSELQVFFNIKKKNHASLHGYAFWIFKGEKEFKFLEDQDCKQWLQ